MLSMMVLLIAVLIIALIATAIWFSRRHEKLHQELNRSYQEIEKKRNELEAQVLDRTAAIRKVNEDLQYEIQERMKSEKLLCEHGEFLRSVISAAPVVLWAIDGEGVFKLSDGKSLAALGFKPGELVGKSVFDVYKDEPQLLQNCQRALAGESFKTIHNMSDRVYESWYSPVCDSKGIVQRVICFAIDATECTDRCGEIVRLSSAPPIS